MISLQICAHGKRHTHSQIHSLHNSQKTTNARIELLYSNMVYMYSIIYSRVDKIMFTIRTENGVVCWMLFFFGVVFCLYVNVTMREMSVVYSGCLVFWSVLSSFYAFMLVYAGGGFMLCVLLSFVGAGFGGWRMSSLFARMLWTASVHLEPFVDAAALCIG